MTRAPAHSLILAALLGVLPLVASQTAAVGQAVSTPDTTQLIEALKSKSTRGMSPAVTDARSKTEEEDKIIEELSAKAMRGLSRPERTKLAEATESRPAIDLEINFDFNAADTTEGIRSVLMALGRAMTSADLNGAKFMVAGHTDAKGSDAYNQKLSERRANAVKTFLTTHFNLKDEQLVAVGYGEERLKNRKKPYAEENRRVQVVNISPTVVSSNR